MYLIAPVSKKHPGSTGQSLTTRGPNLADLHVRVLENSFLGLALTLTLPFGRRPGGPKPSFCKGERQRAYTVRTSAASGAPSLRGHPKDARSWVGLSWTFLLPLPVETRFEGRLR